MDGHTEFSSALYSLPKVRLTKPHCALVIDRVTIGSVLNDPEHNLIAILSTFPQMPALANTKVVIFGGSTGLGFGVAKAALAEGASVIISSSNHAKLQTAAERLDGGERVATEVLDLKDEEAIKAFFQRAGKFDHLVLTVRDLLAQRKHAE